MRMNIDLNQKLSQIEQTRLKEYLKKRFVKQEKQATLNVVFDILHECDLNCVGCGTNARCLAGSDGILSKQSGPTVEEIREVFCKCKEYAEKNNLKVFMNIGGGEPFLKKDIIKILEMASQLFGKEGVGVDTNGTLDNSIELVREASNYLSYIGISVNGLHDYHNWWSGIKGFDAYLKTMRTVENLCGDSDIRQKLEVTSVATKKNIKELKILCAELEKIGVQQYSVHRAIPVGRMERHPELIPNANDYFQLLCEIGLYEGKIKTHIHHSIESIYATLLCGIDTYCTKEIGNPNLYSSIGINANCDVVFDPWCMTGKWRKLVWGNLLHEGGLEDLFASVENIFCSIPDYTAREIRCRGCKETCSGGSRIVAAVTDLQDKKIPELNMSIIGEALCSIDPACPLFNRKEIL